MAQTLPPRIPALDLLRFIAAAGVTLYHYVTCYPAPEQLEGTMAGAFSGITRYGYLGVDLFFMISGFVILWSALGRDPLSFVVSRISRLYPSFWTSAAFTCLLIYCFADWAPKGSPNELDLRTFAANATMLPAIFNAPLLEGVYWTLEIEIRFYALIFLLLALRQMRHAELWLYAWLAISVAILFVEAPWVVNYLALKSYGPFFIAGAMFYITLTRGLTLPRAAAICICAVTCAYVSMEQRAQFISPDGVSAVLVPSLVICFFALFAGLTVWRPGPFVSRFAYPLGALTYPLYLTHATMGYMAYQALAPKIGVAATLFSITILALAVAGLVTMAVDIPARKPMATLLYRLASALRIATPAPSSNASR